MEKEFMTTASKNRTGYYDMFGADRKHAHAWNLKPEDIDDLKMKISDNQSEPDWNAQEYWGWYENSKDSFDMIWPNYKLLNICFPYGIKAWEEIGKGKAYRLEIVEINGVKVK